MTGRRTSPVMQKLVFRWLLTPCLAACGGDDGSSSEVGTESTAASETDETAGPGTDTSQMTGETDSGSLDTSDTTESPTDSGSETEGETEAVDCVPPGDLVAALEAIEGMTVEVVESPYPQYQMFLLNYMQPQDHNNPEGQWFAQRVVLSHISVDEPMVLATSGYGLLGPGYLAEPTQLLAANQISVEQRFFNASIPEPADWTYLTIEQAANDHHRLVEALKPIYCGAPWVSTGASKGGMTSIYHRRFFPEDVDATLAYVAPHNLAEMDTRYGPYIDQIGTPDCAQALKEFQATALSRREALVAMLDSYAQSEGLSYDHLGIDRAVEFNVIESRFVFWQYGSAQNCSAIPDAMASDAEVFGFLDQIAGWSSFADYAIAYYGPYYFQAARELGAPELLEDHLGDLRMYPGENTAALYSPPGTNPVWDGDAMPDVSTWMDSEGERLMFIYGGRDPWSATAYDPGGAGDTHTYWVETGNHGANLNKLPNAEFDEAFAILQGWMGQADVPPDLAERRSRVVPWPRERHAGL